MRLQTEGFPDSVDGGLRELRFFGDRPAGPVGAPFGFGLEGFPNQRGDSLVLNGSSAAGSQFIVQTLDALCEVALSPSPHGGSREFELLGDNCIAPSIGGVQDNPRPHHEGMGHGSGSADCGQLFFCVDRER